VADDDNYRIQVYQLDNNDQIQSQTANYSLGAVNPASIGTDTLGQNSFYEGPFAMAYDPVNNRLFVEDYYRVLVFNLSNGISNNMNASYVIGEPDFMTDNDTTTQNTLDDPGDYGDGLAFDPTNDRLFVSDYTRIMVYNVSPSTLQTNGNGENASYVIGQTNFTNTNEACTQSGLNRASYDEDPFSLAFDNVNQRLFVSDGQCERVLVFNVSPSTLQTNGNGENASYVIGEPDFVTVNDTTSRNTLDTPNGIGYDPTNNSLYVGDYYGNRIMVYDVSPSTLQTNGNGENAYAVIGQPDFTTLNAGTTQTEILYNYYSNASYAIDPTDNQLFLADQGSNRVLTYNFITMTNSSQLNSGTIGKSYSQTLTSVNSQGTVTYAVTGGSLPPGLSLNGSTGLISGTPTSTGNYTFEITAYDNIGTAGTFQDDPSYTISVGSGTAVTSPNTGFGKPIDGKTFESIIIYSSTSLVIISIGLGLRKFSKNSLNNDKGKQ
jgi:hypothetical protein